MISCDVSPLAMFNFGKLTHPSSSCGNSNLLSVEELCDTEQYLQWLQRLTLLAKCLVGSDVCQGRYQGRWQGREQDSTLYQHLGINIAATGSLSLTSPQPQPALLRPSPCRIHSVGIFRTFYSAQSENKSRGSGRHRPPMLWDQLSASWCQVDQHLICSSKHEHDKQWSLLDRCEWMCLY